jgi:multidrug transporter EmrE-like cation transporter
LFAVWEGCGAVGGRKVETAIFSQSIALDQNSKVLTLTHHCRAFSCACAA